jgi:hypothetical protein
MTIQTHAVIATVSTRGATCAPGGYQPNETGVSKAARTGCRPHQEQRALEQKINKIGD